jgi:hypothetical protein
VQVKPFDSEIVGELKTTISQIIAKKLSIKQDVIEDLKTAEELFPVRTELEPTTILSPLRTPSTSGILLDDDVGKEYEKRTKHKHTDKTEEKIERKRRRKDEGGHKGNPPILRSSVALSLGVLISLLTSVSSFENSCPMSFRVSKSSLQLS